MKIVPYNPEYHDELTQILREYLVFTGEAIRVPPWNHEIDVEKHLGVTLKNLHDFAPPKGEILLAVIDGHIAGTSTVKMIRGATAELKRMYVKPEFQGKKIGHALVLKSIEIARGLGATQMLLDTPPPFKPAHKLYQRHGFTFCDEYPEVGIPEELKFNWLYMHRTL